MTSLLLAMKQVFCFHRYSFNGSIAVCEKCGDKCFHKSIRIVRCWNSFKKFDIENDRPHQYIIKCFDCCATFFEQDTCDFELYVEKAQHKIGDVKK